MAHRPIPAPASPEGLLFVRPRWIIRRGDGRADVLDLGDGTALALTGTVADALFAAEPRSSELGALSGFEPRLEALVADLSRNGPEVLDRSTVLRGSGYSQLFLELTARCNERCVHCYAEAGPHRTEELSQAAALAVVDDAARLGFSSIQLTGGDPLLAATCPAVARRAVALGFSSVEIYTNGLALQGRLLEELVALPLSWALSFYSVDPSSHDAITATPGSHARTSRAIRRLVERGRPVRVGIVVTELNATDVAATVRYVQALGVPERAIGVEVERSAGRGVFSLRPDRLPAIGRRGVHRAATATPFAGRIAVAHDGTVYPCIFSRTLPLGNVHEGGLLAVLSERTPVSAALDRILDGASRWRATLSCRDCRLRAELLAPKRPAAGAP